jgi:hypothetical protein
MVYNFSHVSLVDSYYINFMNSEFTSLDNMALMSFALSSPSFFHVASVEGLVVVEYLVTTESQIFEP